jgi:hypothetical protein
MKSLKELEIQLDKEVKFLETDPDQVAIAKVLDFLDRDIAGQISDKESDDFFNNL